MTSEVKSMMVINSHIKLSEIDSVTLRAYNDSFSGKEVGISAEVYLGVVDAQVFLDALDSISTAKRFQPIGRPGMPPITLRSVVPQIRPETTSTTTTATNSSTSTRKATTITTRAFTIARRTTNPAQSNAQTPSADEGEGDGDDDDTGAMVIVIVIVVVVGLVVACAAVLCYKFYVPKVPKNYQASSIATYARPTPNPIFSKNGSYEPDSPQVELPGTFKDQVAATTC